MIIGIIQYPKPIKIDLNINLVLIELSMCNFANPNKLMHRKTNAVYKPGTAFKSITLNVICSMLFKKIQISIPTPNGKKRILSFRNITNPTNKVKKK